jgi:hypothetical protein
MGRYYSGNIEGKFWFGTQSSDDATNFGVDPVEQYDYYGCLCCATDDIDANNGNEEENAKLFCSSCYESLEDHLEKTEEDRNGSNLTYCQCNEIYYDFQQSSLPTLIKEIKKLEKKVGKYMEPFTIIDKTAECEGVQYDYRVPEGTKLKKGELELIARLCLGKQILFCVETYGSCGFHAEL